MSWPRSGGWSWILFASALLAVCCSDGGGVTTDGGGPGGDGPAATSAPFRFGFLSAYGQPAVDLEWKKKGKDLAQFSSGLVKELGARWARELIFIYPRSTTLGSMEAAALKQAKADGVNVMAVVAVDQKDFPSKETESMTWIGQVVSNLSGQVKYWQVHNEVGKDGRYKKSADYLELLKAASAAIRKACADCKVVMGSTTPDASYFAALVDGGDALVDAYDAHLFDENHFSLLEQLRA